MARANVPVTPLGIAGDDISGGATTFDGSNGAMFENPDGKTVVILKNNGGGTHVITFKTPHAPQGLALAEHTVSLGAGKTFILTGFRPDIFNQQSGANVGKIEMDADGTQSEVVALVYRPG